MSRDESLYLADIKDCCEKALKYTVGYTLKDLIHDDRTFDAIVTHKLSGAKSEIFETSLLMNILA